MNVSADYPSLKEAADASSASAQRKFLTLNVAQLALLISGALVSAWTPATLEKQRLTAIATAALMFIALGVATSLRLTKFDDRWFRCRALAENIKSAVWYFVMSPTGSVTAAEATYLTSIAELQDRLAEIAKEVASRDNAGPLITAWMKTAQQLPFAEKMQMFRENRLQDQIQWYSAKAKLNARREKIWFALIFSAEFAAVAFATFQVWRLWEFNAAGPIAAVSAGFIAWMQIKRFSDLALSYGIAAVDLRHIGARWEHATTEEEIQGFVKEVETAISREHSVWLSRRLI